MAKLKIDSPSLLLLLAFLIVASGPELKADVTGSILGAVTDAGGGVLPGVEVVATNLETNQRQSTRTDNLGQYRILAMPVGTYKVEASAPGFQKFLETGIDLTVNQQHRVDIVLQVGNVEQQVEVNAAALQVETTATQLGDVVEEKRCWCCLSTAAATSICWDCKRASHRRAQVPSRRIVRYLGDLMPETFPSMGHVRRQTPSW